MFDFISDWFADLWISLWLLIDNVIYLFINYVYRIFLLVAKVNIFGDGEQLVAITNRLYVIVGVAMLFIFAYNLIMLIINPDGKQIANMGKVVKDAITSVIIVILLPLIFQYMTTVQNHILDRNIIGQIIIGTTSEELEDSTNERAGVKVALDIFSAFYHPVGANLLSCSMVSGKDVVNLEKNEALEELDFGYLSKDVKDACKVYVDAYNKAYENSSISTFISNEKMKEYYLEDDNIFEYNYILSTVAGCICLWLFVSFALDVGVRVGKLAFYQIVAPIPVMMRILPNDKMFDKWVKGLKDAYLSLFIRLIIVFFSVYAISLVPSVVYGMWVDTTLDVGLIIQLANVVVILGILMFAKEAPKLIADLFGSSGGIKFGIGSKIRDNKFGMGAMGALGAGFGGMVANARNSWKDIGRGRGFRANSKSALGVITSGAGGFFGGLRRGAVSGYKSDSFKGLGRGITQAKLDTTAARNKHKANRNDRRALGTDIIGADIPVVSSTVGMGANVISGIGGAVSSAWDWLGDDSASAHRGKAINGVKDELSKFKSGSYYNKGTYSSTQQDAWLEEIRKGGSVTIGDNTYGIGKTIDGEKLYSYEKVESAVKSAISGHNKSKTIQSYLNNADMVANDLEAIYKSFNDNRAAFGKTTEQAIAKELQDVIKKSSNTVLKALVSGDSVNWGEANKLLSMKEADVKKSSVETREALYEFVRAAESGLKRADILNKQMKENESKK